MHLSSAGQFHFNYQPTAAGSRPALGPVQVAKYPAVHSRLLAALAALGLLLAHGSLAGNQFTPGAVWLDTSNNPIQAHGGGILHTGKTYYWYGEDRTPGGSGVVACYSSTNLFDWQREGVALSRFDLPRINGERCFVERPKVIFNPRTGKYVMWMHLEQNGYRYSRAGIAVSDTPAGRFKFLQAIRPVANTNAFPTDDNAEQNLYGGTFRDMNLFVDDDGQAYVLYSSEGNWTLYIVRLNDDFTGPATPLVEGQTWARVLARKMREGAAPFTYLHRYYLITSACTGWAPNAADCAVATNILGPYAMQGNPCVGTNASRTFEAQSTFVLPAPDRPGQFIFMADEWRPQNLPDSRYVWLPFTVATNGTIAIPWRQTWDWSVFSDPLEATPAR